MCIIFSVGAWPLSQTGRDEFKGKALGTLTIYEDNFAPLPLPPPPPWIDYQEESSFAKEIRSNHFACL